MFTVSWKPKRAWLWDIAATTDTILFLEFNQVSDKLLKVWVHKADMYAVFVLKKQFFLDYMDGVAKPEYAGFTLDANRILCGG